MSKLEKCPFCGEEEKIYVSPRLMPSDSYYYYCECRKCHSYTDDHPTEQEATAAWNRRTPMEESK